MQPNQNPNQPANPNQQPAPAAPEAPLQPGAEQAPAPAAPEAAPAATQGAPASPAQSTQLPQIPNVPAQQLPGDDATQPQDPAPAAALGPNPNVAEDVDVIEKEWVDQAEKVIQQTQDDPYVEEEAVESLQIDYLKKRYGHDVKKANDQN